MCCSCDCYHTQAQKPLLVCTLSTSSVLLPVCMWCGADRVALMEVEMDKEEQEEEAVDGTCSCYSSRRRTTSAIR